MGAVDRNELDFTEGFAVHGIKQQIILKEGESIIWSRDKLKASQPWIDPVCALVDGIWQRAWGQQKRNGEYLSSRQNVHFGKKAKMWTKWKWIAGALDALKLHVCVFERKICLFSLALKLRQLWLSLSQCWIFYRHSETWLMLHCQSRSSPGSHLRGLPHCYFSQLPSLKSSLKAIRDFPLTELKMRSKESCLRAKLL